MSSLPTPTTSKRLAELRGVALFLAPAVVLVGMFMFYPIGMSVWMALNKVDQFGHFSKFVGVGNFTSLFSDADFRSSIYRTIIWTVAVVVVTTVISLFLAVVLIRRFPFRAVARSLLLLPWATSLVISTLLWQWIANPDFGALNHLLSSIGISHDRIDWLAEPSHSFPLMVGIAIWASVPPTTLMLVAGLQGIDASLYEAGALDGAKGWHTFLDITVPQLRPVLAVTILLNVIFVFNSFPIIWVLTQGGPAGQTDTLVTYLYKQGFQLYQMGSAAAVAIVIFAILLVFSIVHTRLSWRGVLQQKDERLW
jgi:multiple sugar transport system permease protein